MNKKAVASELLKVADILAGIQRKASIGVGETIETGNLRIERRRMALVVTDLTNAGKRGKTVQKILIYDLDLFNPSLAEDLAEELSKAKTFNQAEKIINEFAEENGVTEKVDTSVLKGVDVAPANVGVLEINGSKVYVKATFSDFVIRDKLDMNNEPTCIPSLRAKKTSVAAFYRFVTEKKDWLKSAEFGEVTQEMAKRGIGYHYYCAVD